MRKKWLHFVKMRKQMEEGVDEEMPQGPYVAM